MVYKWCCSAVSRPVSHFSFFIGANWVSSTFSQFAVADPGKGPGEATPLFLDQTEAWSWPKKSFWRPEPHLPPYRTPSSQGLEDRTPPPPLSQDLDLAVVWSIENGLFYFLIPDNVYVFIWIQIRTSIIYWCKYQPNNFFSTVPFHHYHVIMTIMSCRRHHHHHHHHQSILIIIVIVVTIIVINSIVIGQLYP